MAEQTKRLPINFHRTFVPERHYLSALLSFAAGRKSGDYAAIHAATGIPFGKTEGKVPAIIDYARAMWLIDADVGHRSAVKSPRLTAFGRTILLEDPRLSEKVTQWLCHLHMCRAKGGADAWHTIFCKARHTLGMRFTEEQLEDVLIRRFGESKRSRTGPMVRMYEEHTSFSAAPALAREKATLVRQTAPLSQDFVPAYAAWVLTLLEVHFPGKGQISITELERHTGWQSIGGWSDREAQELLAKLQAKGAITVDRHMQPWLIRPCALSSKWWPRVYDELV